MVFVGVGYVSEADGGVISKDGSGGAWDDERGGGKVKLEGVFVSHGEGGAGGGDDFPAIGFFEGGDVFCETD